MLLRELTKPLRLSSFLSLTNAFERGGHVTHRDSQQARD